ncbi:hypothetical protein [Streptosporangium sp. NBC_01756]|uniref:hypothetical protein n=1 Tax=Streptosporangium sp. NBC_01756 TaxID=2975950 RepID=UPI002DDA93EF|nr:hypothetical protein [Streptosporangium sp. NBC_01756]WSC89897.1 hypothetical protein OIE48_17440 [Streptosporangium sp. NBC_01756]
MLFSAVGVGAVVLQMLDVVYPDGDPAKAREVAQLLRQLAKRVDVSLDDVEEVASRLWRPPNSGVGIDAFRTYFRDEVAPYPPLVSAFIRGLADAIDDYADMLEQVQHTLKTMAMIQWLELLMFFCWPGVDKKIEVLINWAARKSQARLLLKMLEHSVGRRFIYAMGGSSAYAVLDQGIVDGVKAVRGEDLGSRGDRLMSMVKNFAAAMVFYHVADKVSHLVNPANFEKAPKLLQNKAVQDAVTFITGSTTFSITGNVLNRPGDVIDDPFSLVPTWEQMLTKLGVAAGQDQFRRLGR